MNEIVMNRQRNKVYAGFLDIKKAYPSVWWNGLWFKLRQMGVDGHMWNAIRSLYGTCRSSVRVGGVAEDWYEDKVGLRQGCPLSPLLFALYINEMAEEVKKASCGVKLGQLEVSILMFADDVVLLSSSPEGLQKLLNIAHIYSGKWRFNFGTDAGKSEVVVFGGAPIRQKWLLGDIELKVAGEYQYLGMRMAEKGFMWKLARDDRVVKTKRSLWKAVAMGMGGKLLSIKAQCGLYNTFVRPVLEYGAEVHGAKAWEEAERVQRWAGRIILGLSRRVPNAVIQGELGWWSVKARHDLLRLVYFGRICEQSELVNKVYNQARITGTKHSWCHYTEELMGQLGFHSEWLLSNVGCGQQEWKQAVFARIQHREQYMWKYGMREKTTLVRYNRIKLRLKPERFLRHSRSSVKRLILLRAGAERLQVELGRHVGKRRSLRVCQLCDSGDVEDVFHYVGVCSALETVRSLMRADIYAMVNCHMACRLQYMNANERVDWILGSEPNWCEFGAYKWEILQRRILRALGDMKRLRQKL